MKNKISDMLISHYKDKKLCDTFSSCSDYIVQSFTEQLKKNNIDYDVDDLYNLLDIKKIPTGKAIEELAYMAQQIVYLYITENKLFLPDIEIYSMPTMNLNAYTFQTDNKYLIFLDMGLFGYIQHIIHAALSIISWWDEEFYCRKYTQGQFGDFIFYVAYLYATGEGDGFKTKYYDCFRNAALISEWYQNESLINFDINNTVVSLELMMIIHEFSHILLNHFAQEENSLDQEVEADKLMLDIFDKSGLHYNDTSLIIGIFLNFMNLVEIIKTIENEDYKQNKSFILRWEQIELRYGIHLDPSRISYYIDELFSQINSNIIKTIVN